MATIAGLIKKTLPFGNPAESNNSVVKILAIDTFNIMSGISNITQAENNEIKSKNIYDTTDCACVICEKGIRCFCNCKECKKTEVCGI